MVLVALWSGSVSVSDRSEGEAVRVRRSEVVRCGGAGREGRRECVGCKDTEAR